MKILAIHNFYQLRSGEDLAFEGTVEALRKAGHSVVCLTRDNRELRGLTLLLSPLSAFFSITSFIRTALVAQREKPEIALVQNVFPQLSPGVYLALRLLGIPVTQRIFNYRLVCPNGILYTEGEICERCVSGSNWNAVARKCYRGSRAQSAVLAFSLRAWRSVGVWRWGVRRFITPDRFLGTKILPAVQNPAKIQVIFNPEPVGASHGQKRPGERRKEVLFVGRCVREKGIFTLVRCAALLPEIPFVVIGKGDDLAEAKALSQSLGARNIDWLGAVYGDGLQDSLDRAGALILPSEWYDNMPLVLTQAMLAGVPIIASDIDGIPEFIIPGKTGRLARPKDPGSFADQIRALFAAPAETEELARRARQLAEESFSHEAFARTLIGALEKSL